VGTDGFGLSITDGSIAIAVLSSNVAGDARRWIAVQGENLAASLAIPGVAGITLSGVSISINRATGSYTNPTTHVTLLPQPLDWAADIGTFDAATHTFTPSAVTSGGVTINLAGTQLSVSGAITNFSIGSFITGSAQRFELSSTTVSVDLDGDGTADLVGATMLTVGLTGASLTIGDPAGPHLSVSGASFALVSLKAPTPVSPAHDDRTWTVIEGTIDGTTAGGDDRCGIAISSLSLVIPGFCLAASQLALRANLFTGSSTSGSGGSPTPAAPLDWATSLNLNSDAHFGAADDQLVVGGTPIDLSGALLEASGIAHINVFGFVDGTISFSFKQQSVNVDLNGNGVLDLAVQNAAWPRGPPDP